MDEIIVSEMKKVLSKKGYYHALGQVAAAWSAFELEIDRFIWELAKVDSYTGACLTSQLIGPGRRFDALASLVRLYGGRESLIEAISKFARKSIGIGDERNRCLHDSWFVNGKTGRVARLQVSARSELKFGLVHQSVRQLRSVAAKIEKHFYAFNALQIRVRTELGPSPKISLPALVDSPAPPPNRRKGRENSTRPHPRRHQAFRE